MPIRTAVAADAPALALVMFRAVREGPSPYTEAERAAWLPTPHDPVDFAQRLAGKHVVLAEEDAGCLGFMTLEAGGYIDLAFILPQARGRGVFRALCAAIETEARAQDAPRLWTHASLMAQPAFQAMGFAVKQHETVNRAGQRLARALMEKHLQ